MSNQITKIRSTGYSNHCQGCQEHCDKQSYCCATQDDNWEDDSYCHHCGAVLIPNTVPGCCSGCAETETGLEGHHQCASPDAIRNAGFNPADSEYEDGRWVIQRK